MREFMLESHVRRVAKGDIVFERNDIGTSLFAIAEGEVLVEVDPTDRRKTVAIEQGQIFGEVGLISGRKTFQRPMKEGVKIFHAIQDVYLDEGITVA